MCAAFRNEKIEEKEAFSEYMASLSVLTPSGMVLHGS
jgi:hypothetical protein